MRTSKEIQRLAQMFWPDEAFADEATFRKYAWIVVSEVHKLCQDWDVNSIDDWLALYRYADPRCREEPFATAYEFGLMLTTLSIAGTHAAMGSFDTVYLLAEQLLDLLRTGDKRRAAQGRMPRGNSHVRYHVYYILAIAKWQGSQEDRDRLMPVEEVAEGFCKVAYNVIAYIQQNPDYDDGSIKEALSLMGVHVAAILFRWFHQTQPDRVGSFLDYYNGWLGESLSPEPGNYLDSRPLVDSAHYWSYELVKLFFTGRLTRESLDCCHEQRLNKVLSLLSQPRHVTGLYGNWEREYNFMLEAIH